MTAETEARETAEANQWMVQTKYSEGIADVSYYRGDRTICAVFGPAGRVQDVIVMDGRRIIRTILRMETGKRAQLLALLSAS